MDAGLAAPLGGEAAHTPVDFFVETQQIADHPAVEQCAVGVGVGEVGGF